LVTQIARVDERHAEQRGEQRQDERRVRISACSSLIDAGGSQAVEAVELSRLQSCHTCQGCRESQDSIPEQTTTKHLHIKSEPACPRLPPPSHCHTPSHCHHRLWPALRPLSTTPTLSHVAAGGLHLVDDSLALTSWTIVPCRGVVCLPSPVVRYVDEAYTAFCPTASSHGGTHR
jgi:hypothetical protein